MNAVVKYFIFSLLSIVPMVQCFATEPPSLRLTGNNVLMDRSVKDGLIIGKGYVMSNDTHSGFLLQWPSMRMSSEPGTIILIGKNNPANTLKVRIMPPDFIGREIEGTGIVLMTDKPQVQFDIVADGEQRVNADQYRINLTGYLINQEY